MARQSTKNPARILTPEKVRRANVGQFFRDIVAELRKVTWPTREETARLTAIVLIISGVIGAVLALIDILFARVFRFFI